MNHASRYSLVNLTPHALVIHTREGGDTIRLAAPAEGAPIPRLETRDVQPSGHPIQELGFRCVETRFGEVEHLPAYDEYRILIVSGLVLDRVADLHAAWSGQGPGDGQTLEDWRAREPRTPADLAAPGPLVRWTPADERLGRCTAEQVGQAAGCIGLRVRLPR